METLTEPGVLPLSHHPPSPCVFYPKQDSAPYYFSTSNPTRPGYGSYTSYSKVSDTDSWINNQNPYHPYTKYTKREEDMQVDGNEHTGSYNPSSHSQSSPQHATSPFHHQLHQNQLHSSSSSSVSSLPPYSHSHLSPSFRDKDQKGDNKNLEDGNTSSNKLNSPFSSEKFKASLHGYADHYNFPRHDHNSLRYDSMHVSNYNKQNTHGRYMDDAYRAMYYQRDFHDSPQSVKNVYTNDTPGVISSSKSRAQTVASEDEQRVDAEDHENDIVSPEFREGSHSSTLHMTTIASMKQSLRDQDRQQNLIMAPDHPMYRREMQYSVQNAEVQLADYYKAKGSSHHRIMTIQHYDQEKRTAMMAEGSALSLRGKPDGNNGVLHSVKNNIVSSSKSYHGDSVGHRYHSLTSPQPQDHTSLEDQQSRPKPSVDCNLQSPSQNDSRLYASTPVKSALFLPTVGNGFCEEVPSSPSGMLLSSPHQPHYKQLQKEGVCEDYQDPRQSSQANRQMIKHTESPKSESPTPVQKIRSPDNISPSQISRPLLVSQNAEPSPESPTKLSLSHRMSPDGFAKNNSNDSYEEGSLDAKREIFTDDDEDDSGCEESIPHSPTSSPFHDASIAYPHHFTHPYFSSQAHGPLSGLRFQFGALQGSNDTTLPGAGFPFGSVPGVPQDMALVGHMHSSRPPYGSGPSSIGSLRKMTGEKDVFFCHLCSYSGKSKSEFDSHMNTHFEFNCPHCDYTSRTEGRLKRHIKDFHSEDSSRRSMPGRPKVYKCKQCPFSATEKDKFWTHSRTHIKEDKLLQCPKCPFVTEYKHHLEYHLRNHFGSKPFKCPKCNYSCVNKSMLNSHMKSHTNVYQYRCSECTYATKYCHSLKLHLKKYNHKPATVLNQDGSLPQGLDAASSGLSIVSKRGPPRGPRGTRKDKNGLYMSHLFEMPQMPLGVAGMNQILNGMMPFWPMLPQAGIPGHPSPQAGMLPGIRNFAQQISIRADHKGSIDDSKMDCSGSEINENNSEGIKSNMKDDIICKLCSFTAENKVALGLHLIQVHKEEAKEVAMSCGFSETLLPESFKRVNRDTKLDQQQMPDPQKEPASDHDSKEQLQKNLSDGFPYKENSESLHNEIDNKEVSPKTPPTTCQPSSYYENIPSRSRPREIYYPLMDHNSKNEDNNTDSNNDMDILQQMTLKFGNGDLSEKKRSSAREEDQKQKKESARDNVPRFHQIPLDLTKPKSASPPIFSNSPKQGDAGSHVDEEVEKGSYSADEVGSQSTLIEALLKYPRRGSVDAVSSSSVSIAEMSSLAPRKRSRKGKAYKLDTLCLKLQNKQADTSPDSDEYSLNMENDCHQMKPFKAMKEGEHRDSNRTDNFPNMDTDEPWKHTDGNIFYASVKDTKHNQEADEMTAVTENESGEEKDHAVKNDEGKNKSINVMVEMNEKSKDMELEESGKNRDNIRFFQEEAEFELQKLQRSLYTPKQGLNSSSLEPEMSETGDKKTQLENMYNKCGNNTKSNYQKDDNNSVAIDQEQTCSDKAVNGPIVPATQPSQKHLEGDEVDQVEMINTVLENRKKPVPPAVKRGTELAWKLLNDPINPVTTLPLPVDALPTPLSPKTSCVSQCGTAVLPSSAVMRKDMKPHCLLPQYSHLHQSHVSQPLPTHIPHHPNSSLLPHTPLVPHPHAPQSLMSMKPLMSIPIPSTPMAYIPPTNRMMSESAIASSSSRMNQSQKELYECTYCDLSFRDCVMYTVHMGYHSNQNPFQCNSCGAVSRDKVEFFLHIARSPHA